MRCLLRSLAYVRILRSLHNGPRQPDPVARLTSSAMTRTLETERHRRRDHRARRALPAGRGAHARGPEAEQPGRPPRPGREPAAGRGARGAGGDRPRVHARPAGRRLPVALPARRRAARTSPTCASPSAARSGEPDPARALDEGIVRTLWMTLDEVRASRARHRSAPGAALHRGPCGRPAPAARCDHDRSDGLRAGDQAGRLSAKGLRCATLSVRAQGEPVRLPLLDRPLQQRRGAVHAVRELAVRQRERTAPSPCPGAAASSSAMRRRVAPGQQRQPA